MNMTQNILVFCVCFAVVKWYHDRLEEMSEWERVTAKGVLGAVASILLLVAIGQRIDGAGQIVAACIFLIVCAALFGIPAYIFFCRIHRLESGRRKTALYSVWGLCVVGLVSVTATLTALGLPAFS